MGKRNPQTHGGKWDKWIYSSAHTLLLTALGNTLGIDNVIHSWSVTWCGYCFWQPSALWGIQESQESLQDRETASCWGRTRPCTQPPLPPSAQHTQEFDSSRTFGIWTADSLSLSIKRWSVCSVTSHMPQEWLSRGCQEAHATQWLICHLCPMVICFLN